MKKLVALLLSALFLLGLCIPASAADTTQSMVADVDFSKYTEVKGGTLDTGAKHTLQQTNDGWLGTDSEIKDDNGTKVLRYQRLNNQLIGWDINTLKALTSTDCVVYSTEFKLVTCEANGHYSIAMVDENNKWHYSMVVVNNNGVLEAVANPKRTKDTSTGSDRWFYTEGSKFGTVKLGEYNTFSIVYDIANNKTQYWLNGTKCLEVTGAAQSNAATPVALGAKINRFKMESCAMDAKMDVYIKYARVYNAKQPMEAKLNDTELANLKTTLKGDIAAAVKLDDYRDAEKATVNALITEYQGKIDAAADAATANAIALEGKGKLAAVKTNAQLTAEEELAKTKEEAKKMLQDIDISSLTGEDKTDAEAIITKAIADIDLQEDKDSVNKVATIAKNKVAKLVEGDAKSTTAAATTAAADGAETTEAAKEGCGSSANAMFLMIVLVAGMACVISRKRITE